MLLKEAWTVAIEALSWMEKEKISERLALAKTAEQLEINDADALRLAYRLISETCRYRNLIDRFINEILKPKSLSHFTLGVQSFLRLYVYKTRISRGWGELDLEEAKNIVKLARLILGWKSLQGVEQFLGFILTENPAVVFGSVSDEERIALLTSHPTWFVRYCFKLLGRKEAIDMMMANTKTLPTYIRLNTLKAGENEILAKLSEEKIKVEKVEGLAYAYKVLSAKQPLTRTRSFENGLYYIQDKASCFAAEAASPVPGTVLLDVCAAPGAKTTYLAQLMQNRGVIYSIDYSKRRIRVLQKEVARMSVEIAEPIIADACNPLPVSTEVDMVVLDPPCTSTGSFAKLPSAKWRLTARSIEKMAEIQWQMLEKSIERLKPGGTLVYSTCSITVEENEMLIERFLKRYPEFSPAEISPKIGLPGLRGMDKCRRLYPHLHECNGFFLAKLLKTKI